MRCARAEDLAGPWREVDLVIKADGVTLATLTDVVVNGDNRLIDQLGGDCTYACASLVAPAVGRMTLP